MTSDHSIIVSIFRIVSILIMHLYYYWLKIFGKVVEGRIVLYSRPNYSDNAKALSNYLVKNRCNCKEPIYWIVKDVKQYKNSNHLQFLQKENRWGFVNLKTYNILYTSQFVMTTHNFPIPKKKGLKGQKFILLWHGCGYKDNKSRIGSDLFDTALVSGPLFVETKMKFWNVGREKILPLGYPRYDWLLRGSDNALNYATYLKSIHKSEKMIIWMPTYRKTKMKYAESDLNQFPLLESLEEWKELDTLCSAKKILLLIKMHMSQVDVGIDFSNFTNIIRISNDDFDKCQCEMYEFLKFTDALITDYSSVAFDFLLVNKPLAFVLSDFEQYNNRRGFVFDSPRDYMPGHHIYHYNDLIRFLNDISNDVDNYAEWRKKIRNEALYKTDNYCKEITDRLMAI